MSSSTDTALAARRATVSRATRAFVIAVPQSASGGPDANESTARCMALLTKWPLSRSVDIRAVDKAR